MNCKTDQDIKSAEEMELEFINSVTRGAIESILEKYPKQIFFIQDELIQDENKTIIQISLVSKSF